MGKAASRTYKLRLSDQGIDLFLACHYRLAQVLRDFIPYGATFSVAVALLERMDPDDIAAELETRSCLQCTGDKTCFVGSSAELAEIMQLVCERLVASDRFAQSPPVGKLYVVGLASFRTAEDKDLAQAYRRIAGQRPRRAKKN
ncbi:hypothetical protein D0Z70_17230 [Sphingobium terrigena]|jgi:hypothetical protein|uniref:Uncharacterized protein n=1 Tax=Sphingobium terrigena TaxID=2304063 RepID=A0A418YPB3_9SPHN|nr:hypothetical protein [Sphingobium terrigena]RJG53162.1 hypothetical protein D0Z70_17230 [Sphingobium terrigena]